MCVHEGVRVGVHMAPCDAGDEEWGPSLDVGEVVDRSRGGG